MFIDQFLLACAILFSCLIVSRLISHVGLKSLNTEQKGQLVEGVAPLRKYGFILLVPLLIVTWWINPLLMDAALVLFLVGSYAFSFNVARKLGFPASYLRYLTVAALVLVSGFIAWMFINPLGA